MQFLYTQFQIILFLFMIQILTVPSCGENQNRFCASCGFVSFIFFLLIKSTVKKLSNIFHKCLNIVSLLHEIQN